MAKFYGEVQGSRGSATRCGHKRMTSYAHGWNQGGKVYCGTNHEGKEITSIFADQGTNGAIQKLVAYIKDGKLFVRDRRGRDGFIHLPW